MLVHGWFALFQTSKLRRSSGMKGTYIKVLNNMVFEEVDKIRIARGLNARKA